MIKAYNLFMLLIGLSLFGLSGILEAQQAVAPGGMAPVAQYLTDSGTSFTYVRNHETNAVFKTIFTPIRAMKAAGTCDELTKIGPVTKVTIRYEIDEPTETITIREAGNITIHDGSVDSAVCTK